MFNRRGHRVIADSHREIFFAVSLHTLRFIFLFFLFANISFSQTNYPKSEYNINDPRNPNCPCHKQQKLADEEYAQLNKKYSKINQDKRIINSGIDLKTNTKENISSILNQKETKQNAYSGSGNSKHKKKNLRFRKIKFRLQNKHKKEIKFNRIFDKCFEW